MAADGSDPRHLLSAEQRARLRPTIDVTVLEELLRHVPVAMHPLLLLCCARVPTAEEWQAAVAMLQEHSDEPADTPPDEPPGRPRIVEGLRFNDPELNALWRAVEPGRAA